MAFYGETLGLERDPKSHSRLAGVRARQRHRLARLPGADRPADGDDAARRDRDPRARTSPPRARRSEAKDVEFEGDTFDTGVCHMAFFKDPDGNGLMLHHRYAPYADGSQP